MQEHDDLTEAMEDMLVDALLLGGTLLRGETYKALEARGLACVYRDERTLTGPGAELAREIVAEALESGTVMPQTLAELVSVTNLPLTEDGEKLIAAMEDRAVAAAERAAERGPGCGPSCGCGA